MFSAICTICQKPKHRELPGDDTCKCPQVGQTLETTSRFSLAKKVRVTEVTREYFMADVLEGENTKEPLRVYRAGWDLYRKTNNQDHGAPLTDGASS